MFSYTGPAGNLIVREDLSGEPVDATPSAINLFSKVCHVASRHPQSMKMQLRRFQATEEDRAALEQCIQEKLKPYAEQLALLQEIPGVDWTLAAGVVFLLDFPLFRKFPSRDAGFERDLVTERFEALSVIAGQALRFETVEKVSA